VSGVYHAVGALGVAGGAAVVIPIGLFDEFVEGFGVAVLEEVAGFLPAGDVVGGVTPGCAVEGLFSHEEFEEEGALVEAPLAFTFVAVGEDHAEEAIGFFFG